MRFLDFSHVTAPNHSTIILLGSDDAQNYRMVARLVVCVGPKLKNSKLRRQKSGFRAKNVKKTVFSLGSHITALNCCALYLLCSDDAQAYRIVANWFCNLRQRRRRPLYGKRTIFVPKKNVKKWVLRDFYTKQH